MFPIRLRKSVACAWFARASCCLFLSASWCFCDGCGATVHTLDGWGTPSLSPLLSPSLVLTLSILVCHTLYSLAWMVPEGPSDLSGRWNQTMLSWNVLARFMRLTVREIVETRVYCCGQESEGWMLKLEDWSVKAAAQ